LTLGERPIDLGSIIQPLYVVGAEQDHITPWKEAFKICELVSGKIRYVLATSGHILGIISPPIDPAKRRYWAGDLNGTSDPESWLAQTDKIRGSWWIDWVKWLRPNCGEKVFPPTLGGGKYPPISDAPGTYVLER
jgi:polyhydroxyalkanoate synthase